MVGPSPCPVRFVLVEPRTPGNAGAAARAMKNLGFRELVLVQPAFDPGDERARRMAVDAADLLDQAVVAPTLDQALAGCVAAIGSTGRFGKHRRPHWRLDRLAPTVLELTGGGTVAAVFGREDHGLDDAELDRCTHLIHLPAAPEYPSFNLAQSVLLVAYELRRAALPAPVVAPGEALAGHEPREAMYAHLQQAFEAIGFLHDDSIVPIMRRFRRLLGRSRLTPLEVRLLRGLARQILWAAGQAGLPGAARTPSADPSPTEDGGASTPTDADRW